MESDAFNRREQLQRIPAMPCGLYRSTIALPDHEECVGADLLLMLHDHRPEELPSVCLPLENVDNRWTFSEDEHLADDATFLDALEALPDEGLYVLAAPIQLSDDPDDVLHARALVMLGYDRQGHCILFPAQYDALSISFPERGYRFDNTDILDSLDLVNFEVALPPEDRSIH